MTPSSLLSPRLKAVASRRSLASRALMLATTVLGLASLASAQEAKATAMKPLSMAVPSVPGAQAVGAVPSSAKLSLAIALAPADRAGMEALARRVSDPRSEDYHRFLSPAGIGTRFGASQSTVNATVSFLQGKGFKITTIADNRMAILFTGTASQVQSAFSVSLVKYHVASRADGGRTDFIAYTSVPKAPANIASSIVTIDGMQSAYTPMPKTTLTPSQTRTLYQAATLYNRYKGEGVNVGITNFDGYRLSNLALFYSTYGLAAPAGGVGSNVIQVSINGGNGNADTAEGEGDLDIQLALAQAPRCSLYIYDSGNALAGNSFSVDYVAALVREANDNIVDIVSESYGFGSNPTLRTVFQAAHDQHVAMTLQGITYLVATGDYGTDLDRSSGVYPNLDPEILDVGGTVATVDVTGLRIAEDGWSGSTGGYSNFDIPFNVLPSYQVGTGVPTSINRRLFPDVALHAAGSQDLSSNAYYFVFGGVIQSVSGTSASTPTFAGQLALSLQSLVAQGVADTTPNGRFRLGRINDFIYGLDGDPSVFYDVTTGDSGPLANGQEAVGRPGWDFVTGFGAPYTDGITNAFASGGSVAINDAPGAPSIYTNPAMPRGFGTSPSGGATELPTADGISYTLQSVKQGGVGQVAAVTIPVTLQTAKTRRSATVKVVMSAPNLTTGTIYLLNSTTNAYDLVSTVTNTGAMTTTTIPVDVTSTSPYITANKVTMLVRGLKPSRLGNSPFTLTIDQAIVVEKVAQGG